MYLTAMHFAMMISALAYYFLCSLNQQKKSKIAAVEDTVDTQRWPKTADQQQYLKFSLGMSTSRLSNTR